jgi:hypothetical protein
MKAITAHQLRFFVFAVFLSALFHLILGYSLSNKLWLAVLICSLGYGMAMFLNGFLNGRKDKLSAVRHDVGFRYHLLTYLAVNAVFLISLGIGNHRQWFGTGGIIGQFGAWGVGLLIHYLWSRRTIKGYSSDELFGS